jgi:Fe-S oxidoreductase
MMRGTNPDIELWRSDEVHEALDLCLSCKGCKGDCPVNVDMATYKAEFLSHYYDRRLRPRVAYAMGLIYWWSRLASKMPLLVNGVLRAPGLSTLAKRVAGIDPRRDAPTFASQTFVEWFRARGRSSAPADAQPVLLWPDTFTNFFHPGIGKAHVRVLEAAGFRPVLPPRQLCCGRPLYDYGMLDTATRLFGQTLRTLATPIERGVPLVGMEASCLAAFRDELPNLFPDDMNARRLSEKSFMLSEFLERYAGEWEMPRLGRKALYHGHCHHKAIVGLDAEEAVMQRLGLDYRVLDSGCCGLAGSFGFEAGEKYDISIAAGERVLLPAVRDAASDVLLITDGFSCQTQIEQNTDRRAIHLAEAIALALDGGA